jgi:hypothetical protein
MAILRTEGKRTQNNTKEEVEGALWHSIDTV